MKHIVALLFKYVIVLVLLEIILSLTTSWTVGQIAVVSVAVTLVSYLIGDLLILGVSNNTVATLCDAVLAFLTIYSFNYWSTYPYIPAGAAVVSAVVLAIGEVFFHKYMAKTVYPNRGERSKHT
jgi:hypothetical protein